MWKMSDSTQCKMFDQQTSAPSITALTPWPTLLVTRAQAYFGSG